MARTNRIGSHATNVLRDGTGRIIVRYHSTDVVTVEPDKRIVLNTGGWMTATTKLRMNQAANSLSLGYSVFQQARKWFVSWRGNVLPFNSDTITLTA